MCYTRTFCAQTLRQVLACTYPRILKSGGKISLPCRDHFSVPKFGRRLFPWFLESYALKRHGSRTNISTHTSILSVLTWTESHRMLRQVSCGQLTTRSPIIRAIRWKMAPAAATMASMVTERIQSAIIPAILWRTALAAATKALMGTARTRMTMVGFVLLMARWLAYSSWFRTQSRRCLGGLPNEPCCRPFQLDYRRHIV